MTIRALDDYEVNSKETSDIVHLNSLGRRIRVFLNWLTVHVGIRDNEHVDEFATRAAFTPLMEQL